MPLLRFARARDRDYEARRLRRRFSTISRRYEAALARRGAGQRFTRQIGEPGLAAIVAVAGTWAFITFNPFQGPPPVRVWPNGSFSSPAATPHQIIRAPSQVVTGPAVVIDGDTVVVSGTTVRLKGVDAAELGTALGENARRVMSAIVTGSLTCRLTGERTWGREVGYCETAAGTDINREIIARGAALSCPRYDDRYRAFERPKALSAQPRSSYCVPRAEWR